MSLRDFMKERKEVVTDEARTNRLERGRDRRHMARVIENLATFSELKKYIRKRIKQHYAWIGGEEFMRSSPEQIMMQAIADSINQCKKLVKEGGLDAGKKWCMGLYMDHESERERLGIKTPQGVQARKVAVRLGFLDLRGDYGCEKSYKTLMRFTHKDYKNLWDSKPLSRRALKKRRAIVRETRLKRDTASPPNADADKTV